MNFRSAYFPRIRMSLSDKNLRAYYSMQFRMLSVWLCELLLAYRN